MKFIPVSNCDETDWRIGVDEINWATNKNYCGCSFNVLQARLLHMTYPDYLKYLRANGGELCGRKGYSYVVFKDKKICEKFCSQLNKEWDRIKAFIER